MNREFAAERVSIMKKTFHFPVLFFEICLTYDGLVSKALPLRTSSPGRFFLCC